MSLPLESLTSQVLEAAFEVSNELGVGFLESVYEHALYIALMDKGLPVERQAAIKVFFHGQRVGVFQADLVVRNEVILELKAAKALAPEHVAQALNYVKATGKPVAMLLNLGSPKLEWRRFDNRIKEEKINRDKGDEGDEKQERRSSLSPRATSQIEV
jgi:GxxExxY protein